MQVSQVNTLAETLDNPQLHHRKMIATTLDHNSVEAGGGAREFTVIGNPIKISGFADTNRRPPVSILDEHGVHVGAASAKL